MNTDRSRPFIHKAFIAVACVGLILNIAFDYVSYQNNKASDKAGQNVANAFQALLHLERMTYLLEGPDTPQRHERLLQELKELKTTDVPILKKGAIERIENALKIWPNAADGVIRPIREMVLEEVAKDQLADNVLDIRVEREMMGALVWDLALIVIMLGLFVWNYLAKRKVEHNLKDSLVNMRETLVGLEEKVSQSRMASKMIVHDLKSPIGSILGFAQLLREDPKSELSVIEFSDRIQKISERSLLLVESLLAEKELDSVDKTEVDIVPLLKNLKSQIEVQASAKNQKIILQDRVGKAVVLGDSLKFEEVFSNILSNAIKYSPVASVVTMTIQKSDGFVEVQVEDQGPGFSQNDLGEAFQFGKTLSAKPTANESATGYGLYIVKEIVQAYQGEVYLNNTDSNGACIRVRLPAHKPVD